MTVSTRAEPRRVHATLVLTLAALSLVLAAPGEAQEEARFVDKRNGTVLDKATGLVWLKRPGEITALWDWERANAQVAGLQDGDWGLNDGSRPGDWRLPTKAEWETLVEPRCSPAIPDDTGGDCASWGPSSFVGVARASYWSSSPGPPDPSDNPRAWRVNLRNGRLDFQDARARGYRLWPVRDRLGVDGCEPALGTHFLSNGYRLIYRLGAGAQDERHRFFPIPPARGAESTLTVVVSCSGDGGWSVQEELLEGAVVGRESYDCALRLEGAPCWRLDRSTAAHSQGAGGCPAVEGTLRLSNRRRLGYRLPEGVSQEVYLLFPFPPTAAESTRIMVGASCLPAGSWEVHEGVAARTQAGRVSYACSDRGGVAPCWQLD